MTYLILALVFLLGVAVGGANEHDYQRKLSRKRALDILQKEGYGQ